MCTEDEGALGEKTSGPAGKVRKAFMNEVALDESSRMTGSLSGRPTG